MTSIAEDFPNQMARCREIKKNAEAIGPSGAFLAAMIESALQRADMALASGDLMEIIASYKLLVEFKE